MVSQPYKTERLNENNFRSFTEIFHASFPGNQYSDAYFLKKFDTSHSEHQFYGHLAYNEEKNQPAAYFGVFPVFAEWQGQQLLTGQSGDVATHPEHRQKGLFRILHDATLRLCKADAFDFLFAFPNANSLPGFIKAGWHTGQAMETWIKRLSTGLPDRLYRKLLPKQFAAAQQNKINQLSVEPDHSVNLLPGLAASFAGSNVRLTRSAAYLRYKNSLGSKLIRLAHGYAWIALKGNQLLICDLLGEQKNELLHDLSVFAAQAGFDFLVCTSNIQEGNFWLRENGFIKRKQITLTVHSLQTDVPADMLMLTGGDFDNF
jgi:GNAT superfamily N-acetyltransferase